MGARGKEGSAPIDSLDALRRRVPSIVKQINQAPSLALRAAANPLLALAEMGYRLTDELARTVELRLRFSPVVIARLQDLRERIQKLADGAFDPDDPADVHRVLFERLKLPPLPDPAQSIVVAQAAVARTRALSPGSRLDFPWIPPGGVRHPDPLTALRGAHSIVEPLIEYRAIQASQPRLATREAYDRLARGDARLPTIRVRARLQREAPE
jgi:hypothetical protein